MPLPTNEPQPQQQPEAAGEFVPSEVQRRTLDVFLTADERPTVRELCEQAGIHNSTFYRWMQRPPFRRWWNRHTETALRGARAAVLAALTRRAEDGDLAAFKVWLQRFDRVDSGDRQTMQDVYRELIRRFATDEFLAAARAPGSEERNDPDNDACDDPPHDAEPDDDDEHDAT